MIVSITKNRHHQSGYTLIELLLVVTVIALIAALGVKMYRDKAESDRINIAALNIQHVLESGLSYNVTNSGMWPKNNWPCSASPQDGDFVKNYLPNESNQSNFGTPLCWSGDDTTFGAQLAKRFWVALNVGSDDGAANIAQRIAARLPNAIITNDPSVESSSNPTNNCTSGTACYVKATVAIPSGSSGGSESYIAGVGLCDPAQGQTGEAGSASAITCKKTTLYDQFPTAAVGGSAYKDDDSLSQYEIDFSCKSNETGYVYVTPNFLQVDRSTKSQTGPFFQAFGGKFDCQDDAQNGSEKCTATLTATSGAEAETYSTPTAVGCKQAYVDNKLGICTCNDTTSKTCGDKEGKVGASYIAICSKATSFASVSNNSIW